MSDWIQLLEQEIQEVMGCTEPASIAFAVARGRTVLEERAETEVIPSELDVELSLSRDVKRNTSTVKVPRIRQKGIAPATACGLYADPDLFNLFAPLGEQKLEKINEVLNRENWLTINGLEKRGIYVRAVVTNGSETATVVVEEKHDRVTEIKLDGEQIFELEPEPEIEIEGYQHAREIVKKDSGELKEIVKEFLLKQGKFSEKFGHADELEAVEDVTQRRMEGEAVRIQTITGSGNQGIFLALPLYHRFLDHGEDFLSAALFAVLVQIYLTRQKERISDICGLATKAGPSLLAGLLYYQQVSLGTIKKAQELLDESLRGLRCEGAMKSCALKSYLVLSMVNKIATDYEDYI